MIAFSFFMQFFTHPVVHDAMKRKWRGRYKSKKNRKEEDEDEEEEEEEANRKLIKKSERKSWMQLLRFCLLCVFDLVFSPILLLVFLKETRQGVDEKETGKVDYEKGNTQYLKLLLYVLQFKIC